MSRLKPTITLAAVGVLTVVVTATPAGASPALERDPSQADLASVVDIATGQSTVWDPHLQDEVTVPPAEAERIIDEYWTPERISEAEPVPMSGVESASQPETAPSPGEEQTVVDPAVVPSTESEAHFSYTNGKVFFLDPTDGGNYVCSGGAVNSGSNRLVVTAGHCVHPGDGGDDWMLNWIFVPGYHEGDEPRGRFAAYWYFSSTGWTQDGNDQRDFAFVVTHNNASGQRLVDTVGGHGLTINPGYPEVHIAGYPGNFDNGQVQWNCWGTPVPWSGSDPGPTLSCGFGGGSSGGPWLRDFGASGLGYVISNMVALADDGSGDNYGAYYDGHVGDVYDDASNVAP